MAQATFSLCYTSVRASMISPVIDQWQHNASGKHSIEVVICVDGNRPDCIEVARNFPIATVVIQTEEPFNSTRGWNKAAEASTGKVIICVADDFKPCPLWDEKLFTLKTGWTDEDWVAHTEDGYVHNICVLSILTRKRYERFGYVFYPQYPSLFCLHPGTQIWMDDFTFRPISDISAGDRVIGSIRRFGKSSSGKEQRNFLSVGMVTKRAAKQNEIIKLTMASGRVLRCTADHFWAYYGSPSKTVSARKDGKYHGLMVKRGKIFLENGFLYGQPWINRRLVHVIDPVTRPTEDLLELGWLSGIFDGEGTFPVISQSLTHNPAICAEIERILTKFNLPFSTTSSYDAYGKISGKKHHQQVYTLTGGKEAYVKFLNLTRPIKRNSKQTASFLLRSRFGQPDPIIKIENDGFGEVMCLSTTTGNYIADGYLSHNSDTEFTEVAYREGRVLDAKHILMEHLHPDCNKRPRDNFDLNHASRDRWNQGEMLFNYRKHRGFPLDDGPKAVKIEVNTKKSDPVAPYANYACYIQANRDDLCLNEVCVRMFDEGIRNFFFCIPDEYWSGKPTSEQGINEVEQAAARLISRGALRADVKLFHVAEYRFPGDSRIAVETRVRNDSLAWVRQNNFTNICVVDSDELWPRGTLAILKEIVDASAPQAISLPMTPIVGFPGYPIDGATDRVISYVGQTCTFRDCRTPIGLVFNDRNSSVYYENRVRVYHFTGTRHNMEETLEKHRQSGHFDDPEYDFEWWLEKALPHIKPGFQPAWPDGRKGIHFFKRYQIWPAVRNWTDEDLNQIPKSIQMYLGCYETK